LQYAALVFERPKHANGHCEDEPAPSGVMADGSGLRTKRKRMARMAKGRRGVGGWQVDGTTN